MLVTSAGEMDIATGPQLQERLAAPTASGRPLTVDLDRVTFIDASGLRVLANAASRAAAHGQPACGLRTAPGPAAVRHHRPGPPDTARPHYDTGPGGRQPPAQRRNRDDYPEPGHRAEQRRAGRHPGRPADPGAVLPACGWQVAFRAQHDGRTVIEVTGQDGSLAGLVASSRLPILSVDAGWCGAAREPDGGWRWWALAIGHVPASQDQPSVTFTRKLPGARRAAVRPDAVDGLWVTVDGLWAAAAAAGRYTAVRCCRSGNADTAAETGHGAAGTVMTRGGRRNAGWRYLRVRRLAIATERSVAPQGPARRWRPGNRRARPGCDAEARPSGPGQSRPPGDCRKRCCKAGVAGNRAGTISYSPGV